MTRAAENKRIRELTDDAIRKSLAEIQAEFDRRFNIFRVEPATRDDWPQKSAEEISEIIRVAYLSGAMDVHTYWTNNPGEAPRGDPEFGEAAYDYMMSVGPLVMAPTPASVEEPKV